MNITTTFEIGDVCYHADIEFSGYYHSAPSYYDNSYGNWLPAEEDGEACIESVSLWIDDEPLVLDYWALMLIPQLVEAIEIDRIESEMFEEIRDGDFDEPEYEDYA